MHTRFREWYAPVSVTPSISELDQRWAAVRSYADDLQVSDVPSLILAALAFGPAGSDARVSLVQYVEAADRDSRVQPADAEVTVLASIVLQVLSESDSNVADAASLGVRCATLRGTRTGKLMSDALHAANEHFKDRAFEVRRRSMSEVSSWARMYDLSGHIQQLTKMATEVNGGATGGDIGKSLVKLVETVQMCAENIAIIRERINGDLGKIIADIDVMQEESNVLWWFISGRSVDAGAPFRELKIGEAALRAGKELNDLTIVLPGLGGVSGLLEGAVVGRMAERGGKIPLRDAVNCLDARTRQAWADASPVESLERVTPLLTAIRESARIEGEHNWLPLMSKWPELDLDWELTPGGLAEQLYEELLLVRVLSEAVSNGG